MEQKFMNELTIKSPTRISRLALMIWVVSDIRQRGRSVNSALDNANISKTHYANYRKRHQSACDLHLDFRLGRRYNRAKLIWCGPNMFPVLRNSWSRSWWEVILENLETVRKQNFLSHTVIHQDCCHPMVRSMARWCHKVGTINRDTGWLA